MECILAPPLSAVRPHRLGTVWQDIVSQGLCVRCGACKSLCPQDALSLDEDYYPQLKEKGICTHCGICMSVCPGKDVHIAKLYQMVHEAEYDHEDIVGAVKYTCLSCSTHREIRERASSGGTVTQLLLTLMRQGVIRKALLAGVSPVEPWKGRSFIARTEEEILASAQSKYTIIPQLEHLDELLQSGDPFALVGLPCHLHAFRKLQSQRPEAAANAKLVIGLFCHMNVEIEGTSRLLESSGLSPQEVKRVEYRSGPWPGQAIACLRNGEVRLLHGKRDGFTDGTVKYLKLLYYPKRCLLCTDYTSELADISVGDPWLRDKKGNYSHPEGYSMTLVRSSQGQRMLDLAAEAGDLATLPLSLQQCRTSTQGMKSEKRMSALIRIQSRKRKGLPTPDYHVPHPTIALSDRIRERMDAASRVFGRSRPGRKLGSLIAFSWLGYALFHLVKWAKKGRRPTSLVEDSSSSVA